jgi:hypothetical protein
MNIDNKAILNSVIETLKSDLKLSSYVKRISHGDMSASRKLFPFIDVGNFHIRQEKSTTGSVVLTCMVEIIAGTKSLAPGEALNGNSGGSKGIVELCDDICDALRGCAFGRHFEPTQIASADPNHNGSDDETTRIGMVIITCRHRALL